MGERERQRGGDTEDGKIVKIERHQDREWEREGLRNGRMR